MTPQQLYDAEPPFTDDQIAAMLAHHVPRADADVERAMSFRIEITKLITLREVNVVASEVNDAPNCTAIVTTETDGIAVYARLILVGELSINRAADVVRSFAPF